VIFTKDKLKHCREYFTKNKVRGVMVIKHEAKPSALLPSRPSVEYFIFVKYEQGDALKDLWNFLVLANSHTLKLVNHYSHITFNKVTHVYFAIF